MHHGVGLDLDLDLSTHWTFSRREWDPKHPNSHEQHGPGDKDGNHGKQKPESEQKKKPVKARIAGLHVDPDQRVPTGDPTIEHRHDPGIGKKKPQSEKKKPSKERMFGLYIDEFNAATPAPPPNALGRTTRHVGTNSGGSFGHLHDPGIDKKKKKKPHKARGVGVDLDEAPSLGETSMVRDT